MVTQGSRPSLILAPGRGTTGPGWHCWLSHVDKKHSKRMSLREDSSLYLRPGNVRLEPMSLFRGAGTEVPLMSCQSGQTRSEDDA
jgi:hypothetical protein